MPTPNEMREALCDKWITQEKGLERLGKDWSQCMRHLKCFTDDYIVRKYKEEFKAPAVE